MLNTLAKTNIQLNRSENRQFFSFLLYFTVFLLLLIAYHANAVASNTQITATRYWAGPEYTRVTLESDRPIKYSIITLTSPNRIVLDMQNTALSEALKRLPSKADPQHPLINVLRVGNFTPQTTRLVAELKADATPNVFALAPSDQFGHRLVLDIYPTQFTQKPQQVEQDSLMALLQKKPKPVTTSSNRQESAIKTIASAQPKKKQTITVAIDPGHGGKDPGAIGPGGTMEKNITLSIAKKLKAKIDQEPGMRAVLIRDGDYFISLAERRNRARQANADLFVSIHADAAPRRTAHGASIYALSENGATSTTANWLAKKENEVDLIGGVKLDNKDHYLKHTLIDLSMNATINDSIQLANHVLNEIGTISHLHKKNVEQAGFAVLKSPDIPSVLVETAFISNRVEEAKLNSATHQKKLVDAIATGLKHYLNTQSRQNRIEVADTR
ncbi:N-acetylmuramoyl-L-alanine amidase AmiC [Nitrosomonas stercoris]|uniref:N-acetylmuramoyl-L-alanine amidase AmiC n=1 Tax=Nitrosomonas stercoris TaxID=1444684 RepID=A0A4Y1YQK1_9PROT|nr:N-acetylmuramoyl-L-alanine amidase AmiC [Nitrosomonas stercoris]